MSAAPAHLWVWVTLFAAGVQTLRFMLQKHLSSARLSVGGATFSRFLFGFPLAALAAVVVLRVTATPWPPSECCVLGLCSGRRGVAGGGDLSDGRAILDAQFRGGRGVYQDGNGAGRAVFHDHSGRVGRAAGLAGYRDRDGGRIAAE